MNLGKVADEDVGGQEVLDLVPPDTPLRAYLEWATRSHGSPPIYHLVSILAVTCHELARRGFHLRQRRKPLNLWFALVGESAMGKSTSIGMAEDFIRDVWFNSSTEFDPDPWLEMEGSVAGLLSTLTEHFDQNRGTTVCMGYHHEMAAIFNTREAVSEMLCRVADGQDYQRNIRELQRRGRQSGERRDRIQRPVVSALFATTEAALVPHFKEAQRSGGIFSRLWWIRPNFDPELLRFERDGDQHEAERDAAIDLWVGWGAGLTMLESFEFRMTPEAEKLLETDLWADSRAQSKDGDDLGVRVRVVDKARVFAAIFAASCGRTEVREDDIRRAILLARILLRHSARMSGLGSQEIVRFADRVEKLVQASGEVGLGRREIYKRVRIDKSKLDLVLDTVLDRHTVVLDQSRGRQVFISVDTDRARGVEERSGKRARVVDLTKN